MIKFQEKPNLFNAKLTAIWAVSESGLGGLLHAIKIPFSGLFLGSFAVIIITYLAYVNTNKFSAIIKATLLVILIKATVSPHSPPMAYIAVLFQGVVGASFYGAFGVNKLTAISFGSIALFESAFQKIFTLTIIFGTGLWESIKQFFTGIQSKLQMDWISDLPWLFLSIYGLLYFIVGIIAGNLSAKLPKIVFENAKSLGKIDVRIPNETISLKKNKKKRLWLIGGLLIFSILVFVFSGAFNNALYIVLRTLGAIIFFLFVFNPLFKFLMQKWVEKKKNSNNKSLKTIIELMPSIRNNVGIAHQLSSSEKNLWKRGKSFTTNWLSLSLYYEDESHE
ncbi:hypothetical protein [Winogradskyella sp. UBA3174]|uniref:hypothetical protein n=1 Tax=Winogradskyella sp. UBA3174 TaxID=1947785 RepID=UPI0025F1DC46|nr:hypothetical protein [Winogradskyella sp. UBA3174]|tara:strand:+ start:46006 stop:47013 length:1008 start_codon:yes stop_codon:yes gene_type:complete